MAFFRDNYTKLGARYGRTRVIVGCILIAALLLLALISLTRGSKDDVGEGEALPATQSRTVSLYTISSQVNGTAIRTADGSAYIVRAESGGRVERVAKVGDVVLKGAVVAQVENSAQRAVVLQAQGAYEAALAAARQGSVSEDSAARAYDEALVQAQNTVRSAFATADDVLRNTVDQVYSQPTTRIPGLRIGGTGQALELTRERVALEDLYDAWLTKTTVSTNDAVTLLELAQTNVARLNALVTTLTSYLANEDALADKIELTSLRTEFGLARTKLGGTLTSLSNTRSGLIQAETAKKQAEISGASGDVSLASAQVKQALGVLESARAALGKTSVKTPVAGTVTGVSVSTGDIITVGSDVVFVASETGAETTDTVTVPLTAVKFTPTKAFVFTIEDGVLVAHQVQTGLVTTNSIAISGTQGITDIVLDVRGLKEGDTVVTQ